MAVTDVLVVSNSDAVMSLVSFTVGSYWGVLIRRAPTCETAMQKAEDRAPQVVVVDADMAHACDLVTEMNARGVSSIVINDASGTPATEGAAVRIPPPFQPELLRSALERITST